MSTAIQEKEEITDVEERTAVEALLADMKLRGLLAEPTPEMVAQVAAWQALPDDEREGIIQELRNLRLTPSLSEIITRLRAGEFIG